MKKSMPDPAMDRVVLIGMMGCGKTTIGRILAQRLGWPYVDNDEEVRALTTREARDVLSEAGESSLHAAEAAALLPALAASGPMVISAAAGVILDPRCVAALRRERCVVYLAARPETLRRRIGAGDGRRHDATDLRWLEARARERDALYRDIATFSLDVDDLAADEVAERLLAEICPGRDLPGTLRGAGPCMKPSIDQHTAARCVGQRQ